MSLHGEIKRRIHALFHRDQLNRDLEEEMRLHLDFAANSKSIADSPDRPPHAPPISNSATPHASGRKAL
jgi:hypothetical protein